MRMINGRLIKKLPSSLFSKCFSLFAPETERGESENNLMSACFSDEKNCNNILKIIQELFQDIVYFTEVPI